MKEIEVVEDFHRRTIFDREGIEGKNLGHLVRGFPTLILFVDGEEVDRFSGVKLFRFIQDFVKQHI